MLPSNVLPLKRSEHDVKLAEDLKLYLGMTGDQTFDKLSMENKEEIGNRLERILRIVANGSLVSLMISVIHKMYTTHDKQHSNSLDNMTAKLLGEAVPDMNRLINDNVLTSQPREKISNTAEKPEVSDALVGLECFDCGKIFKSRHSLFGHRREIHSGETEVHSCPECGKTFGRKRNLKAHRESQHYGKRFPCQLCVRTFSKRSSVKEHINNIHKNKYFRDDAEDKGSESECNSTESRGHKPEEKLMGQYEGIRICGPRSSPKVANHRLPAVANLFRIHGLTLLGGGGYGEDFRSNRPGAVMSNVGKG